MHTCAHTHTKTQDTTTCICLFLIYFFQSKQWLCVCVYLTPVMGFIDKVNLKGKQPQTRGTRKWQRMRKKKKMCIHPQRILAMCGFVFTAVSAFFRQRVCVSEFVVWIQLSDWCVKSLTASLWLVRTGRQHYPGRGKKRTEMQDRPGLLLGRPTSVQWLVKGRARKRGTAAVSFNEPLLRSSAFNLQGCPALLLPIPSFHTNPCNKHKSRLVSCRRFPTVVYNS